MIHEVVREVEVVVDLTVQSTIQEARIMEQEADPKDPSMIHVDKLI